MYMLSENVSQSAVYFCNRMDSRETMAVIVYSHEFIPNDGAILAVKTYTKRSNLE
jgi:hypothetical protein